VERAGRLTADDPEARLARVETRQDELAATLRVLESRLAALEAGAPGPAAPGFVLAAEGARGPETGEDPLLGSLPLVGKCLLVLGGAFLVRALTDAGTLPRAAGIALGLAYAVAWIALADRAGARGKALAATFVGSTAVLIACPLAFEAATRFGAFSASAAAAVLALFTGLALAVAARRSLPGLAWVSTLAALAALLALLPTARAVAAVAACLLLLGAATVGLAYGSRRWHGLRWPVAVTADFVVALMAWLASFPGGPPEPYRGLTAQTAFWLALALPVVYLGSAAARTLVRRRDVTVFEAAQSVASLLIGLGGAAAVSRAAGSGQAPLGVAGLTLAAACYAVAFAFVERRSESARNFHFYASLALLLALYASGLLLGSGPLSALWSALCLVAALLGQRLERMTLKVHAAVYMVAAAAASGLLAAPSSAFRGAPAPAGPPLSATGGIALAASAAVFAVFAAGRKAPGESLRARLPALVALLITLAGAGALAAFLAMSLATDGRDPGSLAASRTGVLSLSAMALAAAWRRTNLPELKWVSWALLAAGAVKILLQDVPDGRPATLVAALALYGLALTFAPRWLRRS
jgi:hypothetical protein